jgi:hypothetical protein
MRHFSRPQGRLFSCLFFVAMILSFSSKTMAAEPNKTIVSDTIYRADGSAASGTMVISWPAFVTADGKPVAAGTKTTKIGPNGAINIPLVPTQGATPAGTYYKVVLSLDEIKTNMKWLLGNGKPGYLQELASRVDRHERVVQRFTGIGGMLAGLLTLVHIGLDYFRTRP